MDPETELVRTLATTTGPISTLLAMGFVWLRSELRAIRRDVEVTAQRLDAHERRMDRIEDRAGVPSSLAERNTEPMSVAPG